MEHDIHQEQSRVLAPYGSYCRMPTWTALALVVCRVREARAVGHALYGLRVVWSVGWDALSLRRRCGYTSGRIRLHRPENRLSTRLPTSPFLIRREHPRNHGMQRI
jgi:hypothetical protein